MFIVEGEGHIQVGLGVGALYRGREEGGWTSVTECTDREVLPINDPIKCLPRKMGTEPNCIGTHFLGQFLGSEGLLGQFAYTVRDPCLNDKTVVLTTAQSVHSCGHEAGPFLRCIQMKEGLICNSHKMKVTF